MFFFHFHQVADSGWHRHQQTIGVWHSATSGCPLWEDRGSSPAAGCESICPSSLSVLSSPQCVYLSNCCYGCLPILSWLSKFTPQHLSFIPQSCVMKPEGCVSSLHKTVADWLAAYLSCNIQTSWVLFCSSFVTFRLGILLLKWDCLQCCVSLLITADMYTQPLTSNAHCIPVTVTRCSFNRVSHPLPSRVASVQEWETL